MDYHQIQQVLLNLINNAQHAIVAAKRESGRIRVTTSHHAGTIRVQLSDNGEGMPPSILDRIFEPFFSTKLEGEGTGLGLSVSYGIVKEHGGTILASSREGEGTTFVMEFPIVSAKRSDFDSDRCVVGEISPTSQPGRILIVDDEPSILDLMIDILATLGHQVDTAVNGKEAARKIEAGHYDLIITDIRMPQMDGIDLYREIIASQPHLKRKIVFMTGDLINSRTMQFLTEIGATALPKPLEIDKLTGLVEEILN
jgi:CheY-like chemotaxis protein